MIYGHAQNREPLPLRSVQNPHSAKNICMQMCANACKINVADTFSLQKLSHCDNNVVVFTEDQTDASALELSKKRTALAGFCKLIAYNMIDMKLVAPVFSYLIKV